MHIHPRHVSKNTYTTNFFHYAFMVKKKKNMLPSMWQYIRRRRMKRKVQRGGRNEREDGIKLTNKEIKFLDGEREPERMTPSLDLS